MTRFEELTDESSRLRTRQALAVVCPTLGIALLVVCLVPNVAAGVFVGIAMLAILPALLHRAWRAAFPKYRNWCDRTSEIRPEIEQLSERIAEIFDRYPARRKGEQFKLAYGLAGRPLQELEEALAVGMFLEVREVFVTAFMCRGVAMRVTASIGSAYSCRPADAPARWREHVEKLGCDEVRQYHNHPVHNGITGPSQPDVASDNVLAEVLGIHAPKLRSFIICWNSGREWKIFEYNGKGESWLHYEFDATHVPVNQNRMGRATILSETRVRLPDNAFG